MLKGLAGAGPAPQGYDVIGWGNTIIDNSFTFNLGSNPRKGRKSTIGTFPVMSHSFKMVT
jgi:hypothetical protein